jgi:hypothetical protein
VLLLKQLCLCLPPNTGNITMSDLLLLPLKIFLIALDVLVRTGHRASMLPAVSLLLNPYFRD